MTTYTVGLKLGTRTKALTIEAEDALLAALKMKLEKPEALITYVRKSNQRGDRRHEALRNKKMGSYSRAADQSTMFRVRANPKPYVALVDLYGQHPIKHLKTREKNFLRLIPIKNAHVR